MFMVVVLNKVWRIHKKLSFVSEAWTHTHQRTPELLPGCSANRLIVMIWEYLAVTGHLCPHSRAQQLLYTFYSFLSISTLHTAAFKVMVLARTQKAYQPPHPAHVHHSPPVVSYPSISYSLHRTHDGEAKKAAATAAAAGKEGSQGDQESYPTQNQSNKQGPTQRA